jgi:hypothetical protein
MAIPADERQRMGSMRDVTANDKAITARALWREAGLLWEPQAV